MDWKSLSRIERLAQADEIAALLTHDGTLGERIKIIRQIYDYKQTDLAEEIGVSRSYLSEVENGKGKASIEMVVGIAQKFFYLNAHWLLTGEGRTHNDIEFDENGWSKIKASHIEYSFILNVLVIFEKRFGDDWLRKQKGARRKTEILVFFYNKYAECFVSQKIIGKPNRECHLYAEAQCSLFLDEIDLLGLPSKRHKELEV